MDRILQGGHFTLFAPTNHAFQDLGEHTLNYILGNARVLKDILQFHSIDEVVKLSDLHCKQLTTMLNGEQSRTVCQNQHIFQKGGGNPRDNMPKITSADISACNGVVHKVDQVLLPYHIGAPAPTAPKATPKPTPAPVYRTTPRPNPAPVHPPTGCRTITELVCATRNLSILCQALKDADLDDDFARGDLTLFAPNDQAFHELGRSTLDHLLGNKHLLIEVLKLHGVGRSLFVHDLHCSGLIEMLSGEDR